MRKQGLLLYFLVFLCITAHAQKSTTKVITPQVRDCGFEDVNKLLDPKNKEWVDKFEEMIRAGTLERKAKNVNGKTNVFYQIPIIMHIVHNGEPVGTGANISAEQAYSQVIELNDAFRGRNSDTAQVREIFKPLIGDSELEFLLATHDPDGNELAEPGITRYNGGSASWTSGTFDANVKPATSWDPNQYANFWSASLSGGLIGYAQFPSAVVPGIPNLGGADNTDGLVIRYQSFGAIQHIVTPQLQSGAPFNGGKTATHEIGHWLGLRHIWGDTDCSGDDFVDDTPLQSSPPSSGCPSDTKNTCTTTDDIVDQWENYMDYTDDACMHMFTIEQVNRMQTVIDLDPMKNNLVNSPVPVIDVPVDPETVAAFEFDSETALCEDLVTVTYTNTSKVIWDGSAAVTVEWSFPGGDITTSTANEVTVNYTTAGNYDVQLIAESSYGRDTLMLDDAIVVAFASGSVGTVPFTENFEAFVSADWDFDPNWVIANVGAAGSSTSLFVNNFDDDLRGSIQPLSSKLLDVAVFDSIRITFDVAYAEFDNTFRDSLRLELETCNAGVQSVFQKGGATLNTVGGPRTAFFEPASDDEWRTETITVSVIGEDFLKLNFVNVAGWGNALYLDNINIVGILPPVFEIDLGDDRDVCGVATLTPTYSLLPDSYDWYEVGNPIPVSTDPTFNVTVSGEYVLIATRGAETDRDTVAINFLGAATTDFEVMSVSDKRLTLNNLSTNATEYRWEFGDGGFSGFASPTYTYGAYGDYEVSLIASNICGEDTVKKMVTITELVADLGADRTFCDSEVLNAGTWMNTTYEWKKAGSNDVIGTDPTFTVTESGTYSLTSRGYGQERSTSVTLTYRTTPTVSFTSSLVSLENIQVSFASQGTFADSYSWDFGDGNTSTAANPVHTYADYGSKTVTLTAISSCGNISTSRSINEVAGLNIDSELSSRLNIFPNPNTGSFTFSLPNVSFSDAKIEILDLTGKSVFQSEVKNLDNQSIQVESLESGVYLFKLHIDGKVALKRLVIQ